ncbi:MAG TPA: BON domain-containing protein [Pyrinomonadaceae bacterium]|nr:BON domain-containing protein [Pyrinomonadaceae bacterium]
MSYDEEQQRRSRVVVETPTARREVEQTVTARAPERQGVSTGVVAAIVVATVALVTIIFLFLLNRQNETNANLSMATAPPATQQPVIIQQPAPQQPPVIVQQPPVTTQPAPIVVTPPTTTDPTVASGTTSANSASGTDDLTIQSAINTKISEDPQLASLPLDILVMSGKVTLTGTVETQDQKRRVERLVRAVKGVSGVDNQITVSSAGTEPAPITRP